MVWYFNFCSPHLTDDTAVNINRMIMVTQLLIGMIFAFILHMLAQLYQKKQQNEQAKQQASQQHNQGSSQSSNDNNFGNSAISLKKGLEGDAFSVTKSKKEIIQSKKQGAFFTKDNRFFLSVQAVQNCTPAFLGHFAIGIGACMMYSPYIYQTLLGVFYLIVMGLMMSFDAWKFRKSLIAMVGLSYILNLALLVSALIGLGLSSWDQFNISCYYTQLNM